MPVDAERESKEGVVLVPPKTGIPPDVSWIGWAIVPGLVLSVSNAVAALAGHGPLLNPHSSQMLAAVALGSFWVGHLWLVYIGGLIVKNAAKGMYWKGREVVLALLIVLGVALVHLAAQKALI